ncbi:MAG TPA: AEC family transporter, partial [Feifaniaceae bacterium]|nr:AEC family transporter [Feifaniaceae bacterium]
MDMVPVISQMGILFVIVALGFLGAKSGVMNAGSNELLSRIMLNITLPCSILYSVLSGGRLLNNAQILLLTGIAAVTAAALVLLAGLLVKVFRIPAGQAGLCKFMIIFSNGAFMGFPVIRAVFGPDAIFYASVFNLAFMLLSYTYGVALVSRESTRF